MDKSKFLNIAFFLFLFVMLTNGLAFAERDCTHKVVINPDGTKTITTDCTSERTITSEDFWNGYLFRTLENTLRDRINEGIQNIQDRLAEIFSTQDNLKQKAADAREREQDAIESQQLKHQDQEIQLEGLKEREEMKKQQQQDLMQDLKQKQ
jgi:hypothetical protein